MSNKSNMFGWSPKNTNAMQDKYNNHYSFTKHLQNTGWEIVNLTKSGFGTKIRTCGDGSRDFGKMKPEMEILDREGYFGGG